MPPRRSHKKSRNGCRRCKERKIKCDEVHPRCGNCDKHAVSCDFDRPETVKRGHQYADAIPTAAAAATTVWPATLHRQPPTALASSTTPARHRLLELRLMHHYAVSTYGTVNVPPSNHDVWKNDVLRIALSGAQHLTDAVLAASALHLRSLYPHDQELYRASHAYMASCLADYSATLAKGIKRSNAESLFLTSALIAFQAVALRSQGKNELSIDREVGKSDGGPTPGYSVPIEWFHALQGVKVVTAASWMFIRQSSIILSIIKSQQGLNLDRNNRGFFSDLLDGLEVELATRDQGKLPSINALDNNHSVEAMYFNAQRAGVPPSVSSPALRMLHSQQFHDANQSGESFQVITTRQAYQHAIAVLDYAHKLPHKGAVIIFPSTVNRRFVDLLEEGRPRALAILTCFFALLKPVESSGVWWLRGMVKREVTGLVGLFKSGAFGPDAYRRWHSRLEWAEKMALWDEGIPIPQDVWGSDWEVEERKLAETNEGKDFVSKFERLSMRESPQDTDAPSPPPS